MQVEGRWSGSSAPYWTVNRPAKNYNHPVTSILRLFRFLTVCVELRLLAHTRCLRRLRGVYTSTGDIRVVRTKRCSSVFVPGLLGG